MSYVTSIILSTATGEGPTDDDEIGDNWRAVQLWLVAKGFDPLVRVDGQFAGTKAAQMIAMGGAYHNFPDQEFAAFAMAMPWKHSGNVVLVMKPEEGDTLVLRPRGPH